MFYNHTLGFIFRPHFPGIALDFILSQKPLLNFNIVCYVERLRIFKTIKSCFFLFNSPSLNL